MDIPLDMAEETIKHQADDKDIPTMVVAVMEQAAMHQLVTEEDTRQVDIPWSLEVQVTEEGHPQVEVMFMENPEVDNRHQVNE